MTNGTKRCGTALQALPNVKVKSQPSWVQRERRGGDGYQGVPLRIEKFSLYSIIAMKETNSESVAKLV